MTLLLYQPVMVLHSHLQQIASLSVLSYHETDPGRGLGRDPGSCAPLVLGSVDQPRDIHLPLHTALRHGQYILPSLHNSPPPSPTLPPLRTMTTNETLQDDNERLHEVIRHVSRQYLLYELQMRIHSQGRSVRGNWLLT